MRIEAVVEIKAHFVVTDTGYTSSMTLPEIERWVEQQVRSLTVYLEEGTLEPTLVKADMTLIKVVFTSEEKRSNG